MTNLTKRPVVEKPAAKDDKHYCEWLKTQPSALSGLSPCVSAHFRTAKNSGTGCKPLFSVIALTDYEHKKQHNIGQFDFMPRSWWVYKVRHYQQKYMRETGKVIPKQYLV
jgi:hypothetical protein